MFSICTLLASVTLEAQEIPSIGMRDEFSTIARFGSRQTGFEGIQSYSSGQVNGSQFFYPTWTTGSVITTTNDTIGNRYLFLFDKVRQELFIKPKTSNEVLQANKSQINSFTLKTERAHLFFPAIKYDIGKPGDFLEVLSLNDAGYTLLKSVKTKFIKADTRDLEKMRMGEVNDEFKDEISYYVSFNHGPLQRTELKGKSIKKALERAPQDKVAEYFKSNNNNTIDEQFLINLIESLK
jgi:hypothetical protein